jgi:hypothetical protein
MSRIAAITAFLLAAIAAVGWAQDGIFEVGIEWINVCSPCGNENLGCRDDVAVNFYNALVADGYMGRFNFGDEWAWERDFKEPWDATWIDTVDIAMHADHGNSCRFAFGETSHEDCRLRATDGPEWGDLDLEWLILDDCSVLKPNFEWTCWNDAFRGLHLICSFGATAHDSCSRGTHFADKLIAGWTVVQAWFYAAEQTEGSGTIASVMGAGNSSNDPYDDHIWGHGSVCSDPYPATYYWCTFHHCN